MKPTAVTSALRLLIQSHQPVFVWGGTGIGKSSVFRQVAASLSLELRDVRAVLLDPVDLRGLPHINGDNRAHWCPPEFLPREGNGILFLDELNAAPALVQAACYQLVLDRKLGEYTLPEGWTVAAAGNRETDRAVTHRMPSALANRFVHLHFEPDVEDWTAWALAANIPIETVAFIRFRPSLLFAFDPQKHDKSFPTPRSWEFVSRLVAQDPDPSILFDLVSGAVGEGAAAEFCGFLKIFRSLPNVDSILLAPDKAKVPTDPATLYAVCGAIGRKATDQNFARLSTQAKARALDWGRERVMEDFGFRPDDLTEDLQQYVTEKHGLSADKCYWSLGHCQGDGVAFYGSIDLDVLKQKQPEVAAIYARLRLLGVSCYLEATIEGSNGRYHHWNSMAPRTQAMDYKPEHEAQAEQAAERLAIFLENFLKDVSRDAERYGYDVVDYESSDEYVQEWIEANEYRFKRDGSPAE